MFEDMSYRLSSRGSLASRGSSHWAHGFASQLASAFRDQEFKLILLWGAISASAALAYLIWVKYPRLRIVAASMFLLSLVNYGNEFGGLRWALAHFGVALPR
ncbi:MAG: hypothetical protein V1787_03175 [Candidatus Micrarchaeota archaeon]